MYTGVICNEHNHVFGIGGSTMPASGLGTVAFYCCAVSSIHSKHDIYLVFIRLPDSEYVEQYLQGNRHIFSPSEMYRPHPCLQNSWAVFKYMYAQRALLHTVADDAPKGAPQNTGQCALRRPVQSCLTTWSLLGHTPRKAVYQL